MISLSRSFSIKSKHWFERFRRLEIRVLIVSRDEMLLRTRELIIGAYFHATGVARPSEAAAQLKVRHFDLIVLCHSLRSEESEDLANLAHRQQPPAKVLALGPRTEGIEKRPWADDQIGVDAGPFGLLLKSAEMVKFKIKSKSRAGYQRTVPISRSNAA
jgi:hypothetical protein